MSALLSSSSGVNGLASANQRSPNSVVTRRCNSKTKPNSAVDTDAVKRCFARSLARITVNVICLSVIEMANTSERKLITKITVGPPDNEPEGCVLLYQIGAKISLVVTSRKNGEAELIMSRQEARMIAGALIGVAST